MARHTLTPERRTLHGTFSCDHAPALEIDSGDTVVFQTLDVAWGMEPPTSTTAPRKKFEPRDPVLDDGPCMIGPVAVRGARPGDTVEVRIDALDPGAWGWTYAGAGVTPVELREALGIADAPLTLVRWTIDRASGIATNQFGHTVALRPFLGIMGVAPGEPGVHSAWPPSRFGGNMDCSELRAGSTLYLPVGVPGALLSVGDAHAAQGDGEIGGSAIECRMDRAELTISVRPELHVASPRVRTPTAWITLGFGPTVDAAVHSAMNAMLDLMVDSVGVSRAEALALASVCIDLRITQVVNGTHGVHAVLRDDALRAGASGV